MAGLKQLLVDLAKDADLQDQYEATPEDVMQRYGLSDEEVRAMLAKDVEALKKLSGLEDLIANGHVQAHDYK